MFAAYYCVICAFHLFSLPLLFALSFKPKYRSSIPRRFFFPSLLRRDTPSLFSILSVRHGFDYDYWFHVCSVGEAMSLREILFELRSRGCTVLLSLTTQAGFSVAKHMYDHVRVVYLPFESFMPFLVPSVRRLVVLEAELWPGLFYCAKKRGAKTILLSARMSDRSLNRYARFKFFYSFLFRSVDRVLSQSEVDRDRLVSIGAGNVGVLGNIKILNHVRASRQYARFDKVVITLASSHEKDGISEEELFLRSFIASGLNIDDFYLVLAPRHIERLCRVYDMASKLFVTKYLSDVSLHEGTVNSLDSSVLIIDTFGILTDFYAVSDVVVLGGSFVSVGGHNPLECASFRVRLISGREIFNQSALFDLVDNAYIVSNDELPEALRNYAKLLKSSIRVSRKRELMQNVMKELI